MINSLSGSDLKVLPAGSLYHYTSQRGLLGILSTKTIWATNILYLNDSEEFAYSITLAKEEIRKREAELGSDDGKLLRNIEDSLVQLTAPATQHCEGIYVSSFSINSNQLSQWRGYCTPGNGFSIGFEFRSSLNERVEGQGFKLIKCIYNENDQKKKIKQFIDNMLNNFHEKQKGIKCIKYGECQIPSDSRKIDCVLEEKPGECSIGKARADFLQIAPELKNPKFAEEEEWRLVSKLLPLNNEVQFREGKFMLTPYIEIPLVKDCKIDLLDCIHEIVVGPCHQESLTLLSVESLLEANNVLKINSSSKDERPKVSPSTIPYRV